MRYQVLPVICPDGYPASDYLHIDIRRPDIRPIEHPVQPWGGGEMGPGEGIFCSVKFLARSSGGDAR